MEYFYTLNGGYIPRDYAALLMATCTPPRKLLFSKRAEMRAYRTINGALCVHVWPFEVTP